MRRIAAIAALGILTACQAGTDGPVDVSSRMTTPAMRSHMKAAYQQETVATAAMEVHCAAQWAGNPAMVEFCKEAQRPKMRQFVAAKTTFEGLHSKDKTLFADDVRRYRQCQAAHAGDYELATECVKADRAVRAMARYQ